MSSPKKPLLTAGVKAVLGLHNRFVSLTRPQFPLATECRELAEIQERAAHRTDISDHLATLFHAALEGHPKLIVELGVRGGESTFVLERVARLAGARLVSVDVEDCTGVTDWKDWEFVLGDDIEFAGQFKAWCRKRKIKPAIDFLFIDTSHLYEHTVEEIRHWFPLVGPRGRVCFHDTNQRRLYRRRDGSLGIGWKNRGVIRALEEHLGTRYDENRDFVDLRGGWLIQHQCICNGFTLLTRAPATD